MTINKITSLAPTNAAGSAPKDDHAIHTKESDGLGSDLLHGADAIALFLFGDKALRRKVYHLAETSRLPVFRLGSVLCARRSVLLAFIAEQEQRASRALSDSTSANTQR